MRTVLLLLVVLALPFALVACDSDAHKPLGPRAQKTDLQVLKDVPAFKFAERGGGEVSRESMLGKVWVAAFIFTNCKTTCVTMCMEMSELQEDFAESKDFRIVATSVDPERDSLEVLAKFGKNYDADPERWYFLRGEIAEVKKFAHEGLQIAWHPDDPLIHSSYFVLVDRQGRIRGYYMQTDPERMDKLRVDLRTLLDEKTP